MYFFYVNRYLDLNTSEFKPDTMNFSETLFSNSELLAAKMEEDLALNTKIISEFYESSLDSTAKRRKVLMPQKTQHTNNVIFLYLKFYINTIQQIFMYF